MSRAPGPVVVNARAAARPELGGVERWARELAVRLPALRPGAYRMLRPPPALVHRAGHAWEQAVLPARAAALRAPLVISPANTAPLAWPRNVVVIHDAAALRHPEWYAPAFVRWQRMLLPLLARRAVTVVTVSEFSRRELVDLLGVAPERIRVVPGGVSERFRPDADPAGAVRVHDLVRPYVLTVASRIARKNLGALALCARLLAAAGIDLVAAGGGRPQFRPEAAVPGLRALGHVADSDLPGLYAGARAFVLPSLYEGFGLPCLEAMAAGVPVVAANVTALPEACGGAALLVDPHDQAAIADAVLVAATDEERRRMLRGAGLAHAATLTWDRAARAVDALAASLAAP